MSRTVLTNTRKSIRSVGYDPGTSELTIEFRSGMVFAYTPVTPHEYAVLSTDRKSRGTPALLKIARTSISTLTERGPGSMKRTPVKSSAIVSVGYDPEEKRLHVEFNGGNVYECVSPVEPEEHEQLMSADSIGRHYTKNFSQRQWRKL